MTKRELTKAEQLRAEIAKDQKTVEIKLNDALELIEKWNPLMVVDTIKGITHQIQIRSANHQRGGGGKRTQYEYEGVRFESGASLCQHMKLPVQGDSAPRVLERYISNHPEVDIKVIS